MPRKSLLAQVVAGTLVGALLILAAPAALAVAPDGDRENGEQQSLSAQGTFAAWFWGLVQKLVIPLPEVESSVSTPPGEGSGTGNGNGGDQGPAIEPNG